jgi:hypothetical protein
LVHLKRLVLIRLFEGSDGSARSAPLIAVHTHFADIAIARDQAGLAMDKISDIGEEEAMHSGPENREGLVTQRVRNEIRQNHPPNSSP